MLPAFLPILPKLIHKLGGGDLVALANSVNVGAHLVDVSPLSTLGALLCLANAQGDTDTLYRRAPCVGSGDGCGWCNLLPGRVRVFALRFVTAAG